MSEWKNEWTNEQRNEQTTEWINFNMYYCFDINIWLETSDIQNNILLPVLHWLYELRLK